MPTYRCYQIAKDGHIFGPPAELEAPTDRDAIAQAKARLLDAHDVEVWEQARLIAYLVPPASGS